LESIVELPLKQIRLFKLLVGALVCHFLFSNRLFRIRAVVVVVNVFNFVDDLLF
jgi:hypothetical protein